MPGSSAAGPWKRLERGWGLRGRGGGRGRMMNCKFVQGKAGKLSEGLLSITSIHRLKVETTERKLVIEPRENVRGALLDGWHFCFAIVHASVGGKESRGRIFSMRITSFAYLDTSGQTINSS